MTADGKPPSAPLPKRRPDPPSIPANRWDVYRDRDGKPVTVTPAQCAAIRHALQVYTEVCDAGGQGVFDSRTVLGILHFMNAKSALMGRMLYEGRPPLDLPPPTTHMAAPAWHLYDADLCPECFGERVAPARATEIRLIPIEGGYERHQMFCTRDWHAKAAS